MNVIVVSGKASGVGKTTLIKRIITSSRFQIGVIKTSVFKESNSPDQILVTNSTELINQPGTDTAGFKTAGAAEVVLLKSDYIHLSEKLNEARDLMPTMDLLIIEGNSILDYLNPDLIIYLTNCNYKEKKSAARAKARADLIIDTSKQDLITVKSIDFTFNQTALNCYQAHLLASLFDIPLAIIGNIADKSGLKIKNCQLGLF